MILVFDLDDTLYEERTYVLSGFQAVAKYLEKTYQISTLQSFPRMVEILDEVGRGSVFDTMLQEHRITSKTAVKTCLQIYRQHRPKITLSEDAVRCLARFRAFPKYVVTDGNKHVQRVKIKALGIAKFMKRCLVTHHYGVRYAKPSPHCFKRICAWKGVTPDQVVYIADNPRKDFIGIKPLGFHTVRVLKGEHRHLQTETTHDADITITDLDELTPELLIRMQSTAMPIASAGLPARQ